MEKTYTKELQEKIKALEDGFDIKNVEMGLLENEMQDFLKPSALLAQQSRLLLEMTDELFEYAKKKPGPRVTASRDRLMILLHINTQLGSVMCYNQSLKLFNRELVGKIQLLRIERAELKKQIENMTKANNF